MKFILIAIVLFYTNLSFGEHGFSTAAITLATADVRQPISDVSVSAYDFIINNPSTNAVSIFVGGSGVTTSGATIGIELEPGANLSLASSGAFHSSKFLSSSKIFVISTGTAIPVVVGRIIK